MTDVDDLALINCKKFVDDWVGAGITYPSLAVEKNLHTFRPNSIISFFSLVANYYGKSIIIRH